MDKFIKYSTLILLGAFIIFYFYNKGRQDEKFRNRINEIETGRKQLEQEVKDLKAKTTERDNELRTQLQEDLNIMDTLNSTLNGLNTRSKAIDNKIENAKNKINGHWKDN